jgi:intracellular sulfur oxidation DsrE/DsrF family protein
MKKNIQRILIIVLLAGMFLAAAWYPGMLGQWTDPQVISSDTGMPQATQPLPQETPPARSVLDITVHTLDELKVLLDRAEQLSTSLKPQGENASVVLVLHGPEVEFFASSNYAMYKDIVDQAARLDAFDIVDVKICQTMMSIQGVARDDIPAFIEQVPLGQDEIDRLVGEGYIYF